MELNPTKQTSMRLEEKMAKILTRVNEKKEQQTRQPIGLPPLIHITVPEKECQERDDLIDLNFSDRLYEYLIRTIHHLSDYTKQLLKQLEDYEQELYEKDLTILRLHDKLSLQISNMSYHEGLQKEVLMIVTEDLEDAKMCREQNQK